MWPEYCECSIISVCWRAVLILRIAYFFVVVNIKCKSVCCTMQAVYFLQHCLLIFSQPALLCSVQNLASFYRSKILQKCTTFLSDSFISLFPDSGIVHMSFWEDLSITRDKKIKLTKMWCGEKKPDYKVLFWLEAALSQSIKNVILKHKTKTPKG